MLMFPLHFLFCVSVILAFLSLVALITFGPFSCVFVVFAHFFWRDFFVVGVAGLELVILEVTNSMHHTQLELSS